MRILTSICCATIILPLTSLVAKANSLEFLTVVNTKSSPTARKADLLAKKSWTIKAENLKALVAQAEDPTLPSEDNLADNSWQELDSVDTEKAQEILSQLQNIRKTDFAPNRGAPGLTIGNPYGFGADGGSFYTSVGYQPDTRYTENSNTADGSANFGIGLGNARKAIGLEINYTMASFGNNRDFGTGGFNTKIHRQFRGAWGMAAGWNGFLNLGDENDFEGSYYFVTSKIFPTRKNLNSPFSRIGATLGVHNNRFNDERNREFDVFGSLAFRVVRPISTVVEWTGSDLAMGISASPLRKVPFTMNIAVRDIAGEGDNARVVFGAGMGF